MRFLSVHKSSSYLVVATSMLAIFLPGELNQWICVGTALCLFGSWFWEPPRIMPERFNLIWNILTVIVLAKSLVGLFVGDSVLITGVYFILFLTVNKLFNRKTSIDYLQLYVLSLLQMIAATALSTDLAYGLLFLFYIVFSTWSLILFHLKREMEDNYLLKYGDTVHGKPVQIRRVLNSRKLVGAPFLVATSVMSLAVFLGSALFFFAFPRIGFRFFNQTRPGISMAGFSDRIELGAFGLIKDNPTVVLRVEFESKAERTRLAPYWRGTSFDRYDGTTWTKSQGKRRRKVKRPGVLVPRARPPNSKSPAVSQTIYLEPMETQVVFGLDKLTGLVLEASANLDLPGDYRNIEIDGDGDLYYEQSDELAFRYTALSQMGYPPPGVLNMPLAEYRERLAALHDSRRFTQLPDDLSAEIRALAAEITKDAQTVGQAVSAVESYLKANYSYTLRLERDATRPPLDDFLFVQKKGHCEYFSTAMSILLRTVGIATRNVNGFYGGRWNDFGQYLAIHQGDAHSWMELLLPDEVCDETKPSNCSVVPHWSKRDPTPSGPGRERYGLLWGSIMQYTDALKLRWYKYVIEYDLKQQVSAVLALSALWERIQSSSASGGTNQQKSFTLRWVVIVLLSGVLLTVVGLLLWRRLNFPGRQDPDTPPWVSEVTELYGRLCEAYEVQGYRRRSCWTSQEFLNYLEQSTAPETSMAGEVVTFYERVRFGGFQPSQDEVRRLKARVRQLSRSAPTAIVAGK